MGLTRAPDELVAGDSWTWTATLADYPAGTWTAAWYFENAVAAFTVGSSASGTDFVAAETAANTASLSPGKYRWQLVVTSGANRYTVASGFTTVRPNPAALGKVDHRSHARKVLDAIEAVLEKRATQSQQAMSINGRSLEFTSYSELLALQSRYQQMVAAEEAAQLVNEGRPTRRRLQVRFK